jgi:hypothetical protein
MADPEIRIKVNANADDAKKSFGDLAREIPGVGRALDLLKNPLVLVIGLFTSLAAAVKGAVQEFAGAQVQSARLDAALARSGQLTDAYRESLHDLASQMQETTGIADDQWFEVIRKLTQFGANEGNIGALTEGVKNLAGIMDGDLTGAANLVARALQGNFEVMSRYGIQAKNVTDLLKELAEKGQGQLEARTKTLTGAWENLTNQVNDLKEGIGGLIARNGLLKASIDFVAGAFQFWVEAIGNVQKSLPGLDNVVDASAISMQKGATQAAKYAGQLKAIDTALGEINKKHDAQKGSIQEQLGLDIRELEAEREYLLIEAEASGLEGPALAKRKSEIEKDINSRRRGLRDRAASETVRVEFERSTELGQQVAEMERARAEIEAALPAEERQERVNLRIAEMTRERDELLQQRDDPGISYMAGPSAAAGQFEATRPGLTPAQRTRLELLNRALERQVPQPAAPGALRDQRAALDERIAATRPVYEAAAENFDAQFGQTFRSDQSNRRVDLFQDATTSATALVQSRAAASDASEKAAQAMLAGKMAEAQASRVQMYRELSAHMEREHELNRQMLEQFKSRRDH